MNPATTDTYTLSLHDALPIYRELPRGPERSAVLHLDARRPQGSGRHGVEDGELGLPHAPSGDRKSTRLNSSHVEISYAVFCLKKKKSKHVPYALLAHHSGARV